MHPGVEPTRLINLQDLKSNAARECEHENTHTLLGQPEGAGAYSTGK